MGAAGTDTAIETADIAPALRPLMARLAKQYTMAQEREQQERGKDGRDDT